MGLLDEWGNALVEEGLREAADTFFGARTALEEEIAFFESQVAKLKGQVENIRSWFAGLNCLLGSEADTRFLFDSLHVTLDDSTLYAQGLQPAIPQAAQFHPQGSFRQDRVGDLRTVGAHDRVLHAREPPTPTRCIPAG